MSRKILFFGNEKLATGVSTKAQIFNGLLAAGYEIAAVIISQKLDSHTDQLEIVQAAKDHDIEVRAFSSLKKSLDDIKAFGATAAVLAAYGKIVPKEVLDLFEVGIINVHPSLLPKHRGPTPLESTILNGDPKTGVSIMRLAPDMDAGPIYRQSSIALNGSETKQQLADRLNNLGKELILDCLDDILDGRLQPTNQPNEGATYDKLITKQDGLITWQESWIKIDRMLRAYSNWPRVRSTVANVDIAIISAHFLNQPGEPGKYISHEGSLAVYCGDGLVIIDQLIPAGSKLMSGQDFSRGYLKTS